MKRSRSIQRVFAAAAVGLAAAGLALGLTGCDKEAEASSGAPAAGEEQLVAVEARPGSVSVVVEGPSIVEPYQLQIIRSRVESVVVSAPTEGDAVEQGQVLVRLDDAQQRQALRQAEIALAQARVNRDKATDTRETARRALSAKETLFASGAVPEDQVRESREALTSAERSLQLAELAVSQAALTLENAREELAATVVRAPFTGVVLAGTPNRGDLVARGAVLVDFADLSRVRLQAEVDEFDVGRIQVGQSVSVASDVLGDKVLKSRVERISPAAEVVNNIAFFRVSTVLDNKEGVLRPGMSADVSILIRSDKGLVVPSKAVSTVRERSYLKVYEQEEVKSRRVEIGADDGVNVVVLEGLEEGNLVVVPSTAGFTLTGAQTSTGSSVIPISVPGAGATR